MTGPTSAVGTTFVLDHGPKMQRRARVVAAERPTHYVLEQTGMGVTDLTTVTFEPEGEGTLVTATFVMHLNRVMQVLARLDRRSRMEREAQDELDRFAAMARRRPIAPQVGTRYAVRSGTYRRHVDVIGLDPGVVHVRLLPGWARTDAPVTTALQPPKPISSDLRLWPLPAPMRGHVAVSQQGLPFLSRDAGLGVDHLALRLGPWADAEAEVIGEAADTGGAEAALAEWRAREDAPAVGDQVELDLAVICSVRLSAGPEGETWALAKILRSEIMRVHLAIGPERWPARPEREGDLAEADERVARLSPVRHVPVSQAGFAAAQPRFARIATLEPAELDGYRLWRDNHGSTFSTLDPVVIPGVVVRWDD